MGVLVDLKIFASLAPNARSSYRQAFINGQPWLDRCGIAYSPLRMPHFLAQVLQESGGLANHFENLNYSASRLPLVWPSRFKPKGPLNPNEYAHNPEKLANSVYGGRMGNTGPNDGFTYRGRGLLHLTGKDGYEEATKWLRKIEPAAPDLVASPDEVISAQWSLAIAAVVWQFKGCNEKADEDNVRKVTQAVNGGQIGISERTEWLKRTKAALGI
jgi:putative chitinase